MIKISKSVAPPPLKALRPAALAALMALYSSVLPAQETPVRKGEPVTLNFAGAEIEAVARTLATLSGRNVVVDPRVKGSITLITDRPVTPAAAWNQFLATLRLQGFTVVEANGLYKVVPEADAKLQTGAVSAGASPPPGGQVVTQIFRLNHETANNLVPVLRPLISPNNTINVNPGNNSLIITDYADNLQRIARIIAVMDVSNATDVEIIPLQHAIASDLAPLIMRLIESGSSAPAAGQGQADSSFKTVVIAEPRGNTLIVRASNAARLALVASLVTKLDQPATGPGGKSSDAGNIHVVYLKNADATKLATTLRAAMSGETRTTSVTASAAPAGAAAGASIAASRTTTDSGNSTGGQIQADAATNSLIITAPEPQYRQLRAVIDRLDSRRAQVFIESLIAEVNADKSAELSIQWQGPIGAAGSSVIGFLGTNFGIGDKNIINLAQTAASGSAINPGQGANIAAAKKFNGVYVLGFLANFLQTNADGNILSTPNLVTLDNEEAKIIIGKNVPFPTGSYANTGGSSSAVNPFTTVERKDVGLTLRVKPQISENGTIKMVIYQEVSSIAPESVLSKDGLITNKRAIETSVLVEDGGIIVLGGLMEDTYSGNVDKIPLLGDVPYLGEFFKSETRSRKKTNLMVFLRPVVLRDAAASDQLSMDRYDMMRGAQVGAQPQQRELVPVNQSGVLPQVRATTEPPTAPAATPPVATIAPRTNDPSRN
ncbi:MAG: type II secretion system secretin GspD [Burkholderiaceae bacterium]|nr:type II secretion system secretin GspD [Burkholderiaceae bacterium]